MHNQLRVELSAAEEEVRNLQRQLREVQKEIQRLKAGWEEVSQFASTKLVEAWTQRDAAIERGAQAFKKGRWLWREIAIADEDAAIEEARAEAAEALAERRDKGMWSIVQIFLSTIWRGRPPGIWFNEAHRRDVEEGCTCGGPSLYACGPNCRYPNADGQESQAQKESDNG